MFDAFELLVMVRLNLCQVWTEAELDAKPEREVDALMVVQRGFLEYEAGLRE